jgi:hypothetical protein
VIWYLVVTMFFALPVLSQRLCFAQTKTLIAAYQAISTPDIG